MHAYPARLDRKWTRATAPHTPRAATWAGVLAMGLLAWGCEAPSGDDHAVPRDVEAAPDVAQDVDTDTAVPEVADAAPGDAPGLDVAEVDAADAKNCPPGTQIEGCPCAKEDNGLGCCMGPNWGLTCGMDQDTYRWGVVDDCCTKDQPWCGYKTPPPSGGRAPLCLSKPLP